MSSPACWLIATSKLTRVRVLGLAKSITTVLSLSALPNGRFLSFCAVSRMRATSATESDLMSRRSRPRREEAMPPFWEQGHLCSDTGASAARERLLELRKGGDAHAAARVGAQEAERGLHLRAHGTGREVSLLLVAAELGGGDRAERQLLLRSVIQDRKSV